MALIFALVGWLMGGILNVLADDLPQGGRPRPPHCAHCGGQRPPRAWLTVGGMLLGAGRCAQCGARWPWRSVLVELAMALVVAWLYTRYGFTGHMALLSLYLAIMMLVTVTDLEHRLVLNRVILPAILLALVAGPFTPGLNIKQVLVGGGLAFGLFYLIAIAYPGAMGAGDVKLAAFVGLVTGFPAVLVALVTGILVGGIVSLFLVITRLRSRRDYIPYGPFLVIGGVVGLLWGGPIMERYLEEARPPAQVRPLTVEAPAFRLLLAMPDADEPGELASERGRARPEAPQRLS